MDKFHVKAVNTNNELLEAYEVRRAVFIKEQRIAAKEEWDGLDDTALHFIALDGKQIVGAARLRFPSPVYAKIERMAVLKAYRRQGIGRSLLDLIETELKKRHKKKVILHAQVSAIPFYKACGYEEVGEHFKEASIEHVEMQKKLPA